MKAVIILVLSAASLCSCSDSFDSEYNRLHCKVMSLNWDIEYVNYLADELDKCETLEDLESFKKEYNIK